MNKKTEKGITLIALIITIIVLIILAEVTVITLTGENGLIIKANEAKESTRGGEVQETVNSAVTENKIANHTGGTEKTRQEVIDDLYKDKKLTLDEVEELKETNIIKIGNITVDFSALGSIPETLTPEE